LVLQAKNFGYSPISPISIWRIWHIIMRNVIDVLAWYDGQWPKSLPLYLRILQRIYFIAYTLLCDSILIIVGNSWKPSGLIGRHILNNYGRMTGEIWVRGILSLLLRVLFGCRSSFLSSDYKGSLAGK
jgi:hypothetical protein